MRVLNSLEVESLGLVLRECIGHRLQDVEAYEQGLLLRLFGNRKSLWVLIEMIPARPLLLPLDSRPGGITKKTKPLGLFVNAHLVGKKLRKIQAPSPRVITLGFEGGEIEVRLFPHGENVIVRAKTEEKEISWSQVAPLRPAHASDLEARSVAQIIREWQELRPAPKSIPNMKEGMRATLEKKRNALQKLKIDTEKKEGEKWFEAGEFIKAAQVLEVPKEFERYLNLEMSLSENIQNCFERAKGFARKIETARARRQILEAEIDKLSAALELGVSEDAPLDAALKNPIQKVTPDLSIKNSKMKVRKLELTDGQIAYMGKSAADNLSLLRHAQPWDLWLHMKDYPGAHVIIRRPRGHETSPADAEKTARWLAQETPSSKRELREGDRFEVQLSECRFVKPIRGDRLGRVSVNKPKILRLKF